MNNQLTEYLKAYFLLSKENSQIMETLFEVKHYAKGDFLLKTGSYCKTFLFIEKGYIRLFNQEDKKQITQWISSENEFCMEISSFFFETKSRWNMVALTDLIVHEISKENYDKLNEMIPGWSELEKQFTAKCFAQAEDRIYQFLANTAEERYLTFMKDKKKLFNKVPHQYIASMLGMSPETLSRLRAK